MFYLRHFFMWALCFWYISLCSLEFFLVRRSFYAESTVHVVIHNSRTLESASLQGVTTEFWFFLTKRQKAVLKHIFSSLKSYINICIHILWVIKLRNKKQNAYPVSHDDDKKSPTWTLCNLYLDYFQQFSCIYPYCFEEHLIVSW